MDDLEDIMHLDYINAIEEAEIELETQRRVFKRHDAFQLSEFQFIKLFRLNKNAVIDLIDSLQNYIAQATRSSALDVTVKVLVALRFFATGSYQADIGYNVYIGVSQSSVSRCVKEVSAALNHQDIFQKWIKFPSTINELNLLRNAFYEKFQFPDVVGCIDCTHVAIVGPKVDEHIYVNRKNYHSINVQLVCSHDLKILNINARYPGSSNDGFIFNKQYFVDLHTRGHLSYFLLGDSGYAFRTYMITPITNQEPAAGTPEYRYNKRQMATRSTIERCNGVLKMRFRCLLKHKVLHYEPEAASKIINACAVLHNICIAYKIPIYSDNGEVDVEFGLIDTLPNDLNRIVGRVNPDLARGRAAQQNIIRNFFT